MQRNFARLSSAWSKGHPFLTGEVISRVNACSFCKSKIGFKIGEVAFWDISDMDVVQCRQCRQMQLDPMLTADQVVAGCIAHYVHAKRNGTQRWFDKNNARRFRAGVRFASYLKSNGIRPRRIMEMGPGNGYFSRALASMIPGLEVVCLDADEQVAIEIKRDHGFETHVGLAEDLSSIAGGDFDLIINRDFLEHLIDPAKVIQNCHHLLKTGGYLYTLTPNGYQDIWSTHVRWVLHSERTDLKINHLNYFDAASLVDYMDQCGLKPVDCYQYGLKLWMRGQGWSFDGKHIGPPPERLEHLKFCSVSDVESISASRLEEILPPPALLSGPLGKKLLSLRYNLTHFPSLKFSLDRQVGAYISCLSQKR